MDAHTIDKTQDFPIFNIAPDEEAPSTIVNTVKEEDAVTEGNADESYSSGDRNQDPVEENEVTHNHSGARKTLILVGGILFTAGVIAISIIFSGGPEDFPELPPFIAPLFNEPSSAPSGAPSTIPSGIPSATPSMLPSDNPTFAPSPDPTRQPSESPTKMPSAEPTRPYPRVVTSSALVPSAYAQIWWKNGVTFSRRPALQEFRLKYNDDRTRDFRRFSVEARKQWADVRFSDSVTSDHRILAQVNAVELPWGTKPPVTIERYFASGENTINLQLDYETRREYLPVLIGYSITNDFSGGRHFGRLSVMLQENSIVVSCRDSGGEDGNIRYWIRYALVPKTHVHSWGESYTGYAIGDDEITGNMKHDPGKTYPENVAPILLGWDISFGSRDRDAMINEIGAGVYLSDSGKLKYRCHLGDDNNNRDFFCKVRYALISG